MAIQGEFHIFSNLERGARCRIHTTRFWGENHEVAFLDPSSTINASQSAACLVVESVVVVSQEAEPEVEHVAPVGADSRPHSRQVHGVLEIPRVPSIDHVDRFLAARIVQFLQGKPVLFWSLN